MQILAYGGSQSGPFHMEIIERTTLEATGTSDIAIESFNSVTEMSGCASNGTDLQVQCKAGLPEESFDGSLIIYHDRSIGCY